MTYPDKLSITVLLNSVDVTDYVQPGTFSIANVLTSQLDTCSLTLENADEIIMPGEWQTLEVLDGATPIFGGYVIGVTRVPGANLGTDYILEASDWAIRFEKIIVKAEYQDKTDKEIIEDLFDTYLTGEGYDGVTCVNALTTHDRIRFNRVTLTQALQILAEIGAGDWYITPGKVLCYFSSADGFGSSPFTLSDEPDLVASFPYGALEINKDGASVANRIEVVGGNFLSDNAEFLLAGTGEDNRIILPFRLSAPTDNASVQFWRNDGTLGSPVFTPLNVKVGYIDTLSSTDDVLYYFQESVIEQTDNFPALANAVRARGRYDVPLRIRLQDDDSIAHYGLVLNDVIVNPEIIDKQTARLAARTQLARYAISQPAISLQVRQPGLQSGQVVQFTSVRFGISASYLIQRVTATIGIDGDAIYDVAFGVYNPDLIDLMITLSRQAKPKAIWREDEVLDEVLYTGETLTLLEFVPDVVTTEPPYYFAEDDGALIYAARTRTSAADNFWQSVTWSPDLSLFVAVSVSGINRVMTSPNGADWTTRTLPGVANWSAVTWSPALGLFVAVGNSLFNNGAAYSSNGIDWTIAAEIPNKNWLSVAWSPELGLFAAVASSGTGNRVMTSTDGISWTERTAASNFLTWTSVAWSPELSLFVAVASSGAGNRVMTSANGIDWVARTSAANNAWTSVTWSPELSLFVAVSSSGDGNRVMTSANGIDWQIQQSAANNEWTSVVWSPALNRFIAVSSSGIGNRVMEITFTSGAGGGFFFGFGSFDPD